MIKKLILSTALVIAVAQGSTDDLTFADPTTLTMNEKTKYAVWNPPMGKNVSGESCKDGNCIGKFSCIKKDGRVYKFFTSLRDKVKKQCKKL